MIRMRKKQGITVTVMVITIIVLIILAGTITFSMYSTINYSTLSAWANEITNIQDIVDEELNSTSDTNFALGNILLDISSAKIDANQFDGENISVENTIELRILDLGKLGINNTQYGNLETDNDVYAFSTETGKVYYVQGIEVDGSMYYTLTDNLRNRFGISTSQNNLSSVIFIPSVIGYTNKPIALTVKIPNTYTEIVIGVSNEQIQIGSQVVREHTYEYLINGNNITGNYTVTVSYNDGTQMCTASYEVNGYDITAPVIEQLKDSNFIYKETLKSREEYLINLTATDESGIKVMKYAVGTIANDDAREYFSINKNIITDGKINLNKTTTVYTIYVEDNAGNFSTLTFDKNDYIIIEWVVDTVDGVPIPRGFVASPYGEDVENGIPAENTRAGGLVIYELTAEEMANGATTLPENETQHTSWTTRNQYVWVPVADLSYDKFERIAWQSADVISDEEGVGYWEATPTSKAGDLITQRTIDEVTEMYASVEKYGGFYIARYEAGLDVGSHKTGVGELKVTTINSKMNKAPYVFIPWANSETMTIESGGAVKVSRGVYPKANPYYGVVSTLTYGVQWDAIMQWLKDKGIDLLNSSSYGNHSNIEIPNSSFNVGASFSEDGGKTYTTITSDYVKPAHTAILLTTGATTLARVNNIYDIAGNMYEWTMEGDSTNKRVRRGGRFDLTATSRPVVYRLAGAQTQSGNYSFRVALYLKI